MRSTLLIGTGIWLVGCGDYALSDTGAAKGGADFADEDSGASADGGGGDGGGEEPPPEEEDAYAALAPASTATYVFVANPDLGTVTRISVPSLAVLTAEVGTKPTVVATTADYSTAVVFNQGSDDLSVVDAETMEVTTVEVRDNYNNMVMSPDGRWVACFHDQAKAEREGDEGDSGGTESYNEVSFVDVRTGAHFPTIVGFNPRQILFTADASRAVVVSDAYLVVVDLSGEEPERFPVAISSDTVDPPVAEEVVLDPGGHYAIVRQFGVNELVVVDLDTLIAGQVAVGDSPTDLDVTPDGLEAVAVARGSNELWVYDLSDPYIEPVIVNLPADELLGSVVMSADNTKGLLFSTASGKSRYAVWDRTAADPTDSVTVRSLEKPVAGMSVSPDGGTLLIFHDKDNGEDVPSSSVFYNEYALTLVSLADFFPNTLRLAGKPGEFAHTADGAAGFLIEEGTPELLALHYSELRHDAIALKSDAVHVGVLPDTHLVYASQEHDLGRISFYDYDTEELQTVTGFELNAQIDH